MDIENVLSQLNIEKKMFKRVKNKSLEYSRLIKIKRPMGLGALEMCKPGACIFLVCKELYVDVDKNNLLRILGTTEKIFDTSMLSLYTILDKKRPPYSIEEITTTFNLNTVIKESAENLYKLFKSKVLGGIQEVQEQFTDINDGIFSAASVYIMTQQYSLTIDNGLLFKLVDCSQETFQKAVNAITTCCYKGESTVRVSNKTSKSISILKSPTKVVTLSSQLSPSKPTTTSSSNPIDNSNISATAAITSPTKTTQPTTLVSPLKNKTKSPNKLPLTFDLSDDSNKPDPSNDIKCETTIATTETTSTTTIPKDDIKIETIDNEMPQTTDDKEKINDNDNSIDENNKKQISNNCKKRNRDEIEKEKPPQQQPTPKPEKVKKEQITPNQKPPTNVNIKMNDGELTLEQERDLVKKRKEDSFNQWKNSDFAKSKVTTPIATKQTTLDSFFK